MAITFRELEYALALDAERSFSRAAERCGVAQPTLSAQIAKFEEELGTVVFERDGRGLRVTPAGERILAHARAALDAVARIRDEAEAVDPLIGPLNVGIIPTLAPYVLPELLEGSRRVLPRAPLVVVEDVTARLIEGVRNGKLDAAIVATSHSDERLSEVDSFEEPFYLAVPVSHSLAANDVVPVDRIDASSLILLADGHCLADQAFALCGRAHRDGTSDLRATSLETVLNLVEAGLGSTIVPALARVRTERRFPRIAFRPLYGKGTSRRIRIVQRAFSPRRTAVAELTRAIAELAPA